MIKNNLNNTVRVFSITLLVVITFNPFYTLAQSKDLKGVYVQSLLPKDSIYGNPAVTIGKKLMIRHAYDHTRKTLEIRGRKKFRFVGDIFNDLEMSFIKVISKGTYYQNGDTLVLNLKSQTRVLTNIEKIKYAMTTDLEFIILESGDLWQNSQCIFKKSSHLKK